MSYPVLLGAVVVTTANQGIRFKEGATTATAAITAGTYYLRGDDSADDLCLAIKTALEAATASTNTYTVSVARSIDTATAHTLLTVSRATGSDNFQILWADALTTLDIALVGVTASTADNASDKTSTQACAAGWVSNDILRELEPFGERLGNVTRQDNGIVVGVSMSSHMTSWALGFAFVSESRMLLRRALAVDADTLEGFVSRFGPGAAFEVHEVPISSGTTLAGATSSTLIAKAHWAQVSIESFRPRRIGAGVPLYDIDLVAHERVSA